MGIVCRMFQEPSGCVASGVDYVRTDCFWVKADIAFAPMGIAYEGIEPFGQRIESLRVAAGDLCRLRITIQWRGYGNPMLRRAHIRLPGFVRGSPESSLEIPAPVSWHSPSTLENRRIGTSVSFRNRTISGIPLVMVGKTMGVSPSS